MKKILMSLGLIVLTGIAFQNCSDNEQPKAPGKETITATSLEVFWPGEFEPAAFSFVDKTGDGLKLDPSGSTSLYLATASTVRLEMGSAFKVDFKTAKSELVDLNKDYHVYCYTVTNGVATVTLNADDEKDSKGKHFGSVMDIKAEKAGEGVLTITLRHQSNKTGECTDGEKDFEISVPLKIQTPS